MSIFSSDAFRHIRRIHIQTKRKVENLFAGAYHSAFKGQGLEFEEVREYTPGDEIRHIDWNVTARMDHPFVKSFREERELTVLLIVDISGSTYFGSTSRLKNEVLAEIGALLAFSAIKNQDRVGLILFSKEVELYLSPKKGTRHVLRVIRELLLFQPLYKGTSISKALSFLGQIQKKKAVCFLISDFLTEAEDFNSDAALIAKKHELIAIQLRDPYEKEFPSLGLINLCDLETNKETLVDTTNIGLKEKYKQQALEKQKAFEHSLKRMGIPLISLADYQSYTAALHQFFTLRRKRV